MDIANLVPQERGAYLNSYNYFRKLIKQNRSRKRAPDDGISPITLVKLRDGTLFVRNGASRVAALKNSGETRAAYVLETATESDMKRFEGIAAANVGLVGFQDYPVCMDIERTKEAPPEALE